MWGRLLKRLSFLFPAVRRQQRQRHKKPPFFRLLCEQMEERTLPTVNISDIAVVEGNPVHIADTLNPGVQTKIYQINGTAGTRLFFDSLSTAGARESPARHIPGAH